MNTKKILSWTLSSATVLSAGFAGAFSLYAYTTDELVTILSQSGVTVEKAEIERNMTATGLDINNVTAVVENVKGIASGAKVSETIAIKAAYDMFKTAGINGQTLASVVEKTTVVKDKIVALNDEAIQSLVSDDGSINKEAVKVLPQELKKSLEEVAAVSGCIVKESDSGYQIVDKNNNEVVKENDVKEMVKEAAQQAKIDIINRAINNGGDFVLSSGSGSSTSSTGSIASAVYSNVPTVTYSVDVAKTPVVDAKKAFNTLLSDYEKDNKNNKAVVFKTSNAVWTFESKDLIKDVTKWTNFNLTVNTSNVDKSSVVPTNIANVLNGKNAIVIDFVKNGLLPGTAKIDVNVGTQYKDKEMYAYYLYNDGKTAKFQLVSKSIKVDANGNVKVSTNHGCDFILVEKAVAESLGTSLSALEIK